MSGEGRFPETEVSAKRLCDNSIVPDEAVSARLR